MAFYDKFDKKYWDELASSLELFNPYPLTQSEIDISLMVSKEILWKYKERIMDKYPQIPFGSVLKEATNVFNNLGLDNSAARAVSILSQMQFKDNSSLAIENFTVQSLPIRTGAFVCKHPYYIEVPRAFNISSISFMAHEITHILKEDNPKECRGVYSDNEVIPMLIEMISAHKKGDDNVFKKRELLMLDIVYKFNGLREDLDCNRIREEDFNGFNAFYRHTILYLNSFYYSLKFFNMYLESPQYVIGIINDVLTHRLTTREVINFYLSTNDNSYESGMSHFRNKLY